MYFKVPYFKGFPTWILIVHDFNNGHLVTIILQSTSRNVLQNLNLGVCNFNWHIMTNKSITWSVLSGPGPTGLVVSAPNPMTEFDGL